MAIETNNPIPTKQKDVENDVLEIVKSIHKKMEECYGNRLENVYLFGSYARGEEQDQSDIDVAVVLSNVEQPQRERKKWSGFLSSLSIEHNCVISTVFLEREKLESGTFQIYRDIVREGIPV